MPLPWKGTLAVAGGALAAAAAVGALFMARPQALITGRLVGAVIRREGASYAPRWSRLEVATRALSFGRHRYSVSAADFCLKDPGGAFSACFSEFELSVVVRYSRRGPEVERVERFTAVSDGAALDMTRPRRQPAGSASLARLRAVPVDALRVSLTRFTAVFAKATLSGGVRAAVDPGARRPLSFALDARARTAAGARRLKVQLAGDGDLFSGAKPTYANLEAAVDLSPAGRARGAVRLRRAGRGYSVSGGAEALASTGSVRGVRLDACTGSLDAVLGVALNCRYLVLPARAGGVLDAAKGRVALKASRAGPRYQAALEADVDPIASWYTVTGKVVLRASGRLDRPWKDAALSHEVKLRAGVTRFQEIVAKLRDTTYAIPAPIHILDGPLTLTVDSHGDPRSERSSARYEFVSDLAGGRQKVRLRGVGEATAYGLMTPARRFEHAGNLMLEEVALEVPRLDVGRAPKVLVDSRIKTGEVKVSTESARPSMPLRGSLSLKTVKPLLLFSNLAKDPVPVALDLTVSFPPTSVAGLVSVRTFGVELFRRSATVDHLIVTLSSGSPAGALEGLVRYQAPGAAIGIRLLGTTQKPVVELTSEPPLKREAIIGLLIFGKNPDELDPEQTASVQNTETALESQAFGLASLYLFGATPIEHVGYDPATKTTSVKLRLPGGANLTLGSDFDQSRQLTVRKPLTAHWAIQSEFTEQGKENRGAATFLEWLNRY